MPVINYKTRSARAENFMPFPVRVPDLTDVRAISAGNMHSLALLTDGTCTRVGREQVGTGRRRFNRESQHAYSCGGRAKCGGDCRD